jgi:Mg2+/Co2+ transporter CorC
MSVEESIANVEVVRGPQGYVAKVQSELGGVREYRGSTFEAVLEQIVIDLQEEFEVPELGP